MATQRKSGRRRVLSRAATAQALRLLMSEGSPGARDVAQKLYTKGFTSTIVHKATVIRACKALAAKEGQPIHAVRGKPAKRLTHDTKSKRLLFCNLSKRRSWKHVMFTDRKRFFFSYPGARVMPVAWVPKGKPRQACCVNHPQCVNVYLGITKYGVTACKVVAGSSNHQSTFVNKAGKISKNITSSEYQAVLTSTLLPGGRRLFGNKGIHTWTLQQDNDPSHRVAAATVREWNAREGCCVALLRNWPPNSPDLNPIENVWAYVQAKVNARGCKSFAEFRNAVLDECSRVPVGMLWHLIESMPRRIAGVLSARGDKVDY